jgi:hypothetical protein
MMEYPFQTYFLEKERHWKTICIEPIPSVFEKNRNFIVENCCISDVKGYFSEFLQY